TTGPVVTTVKINGHGFSPQADSNHVSFNGYRTDVLKADSTTLIVKVPKEATTGSKKVKAGNQTAEGPTRTVTETARQQVEVTEIAPKQGPVGTDVTIKGQNFNTTKKNNTVTFNSAKAAIKSASKTKLVVSVPQKATDGPVKVTVNGQTASGPSFDITQKPIPQVQVTGLSPKKGPVGTKVTITGKNFSSTKSKNTVMFNGTKATIKSASTTKLVVTVPQGATNGPVKVTTNGQTATGPSFTVTPDPDEQLTISGISPKVGPTGTSVTITGTNFSSTKSENTVTFNGTKATISSASTTKLIISVPQGATDGLVKVQVGNQTAEGPSFDVTQASIPQVKISNISPKQGPVGTEVTIKGKNFNSNEKKNTITFNGTKAAIKSASKTKLVVT